MLKAHGYTPTIIYVQAGAAVMKHQLVYMTSAATAMPAFAGGSDAIGFALHDAAPGDFLAVQTDGVIYDWSGTPATLVPGSQYFQATTGDISDVAPSSSPFPVGVAIEPTILHIRFGSAGTTVVSGGGGGGYATFEEYISVTAADVANQFITLASPFAASDELVEVILGGGSIHLLPGTDYRLDKSNPALTGYDLFAWDSMSLSLLSRLLEDDLITLKRKVVSTLPPGLTTATSVVYLSGGVVTSSGALTFQEVV